MESRCDLCAAARNMARNHNETPLSPSMGVKVLLNGGNHRADLSEANFTGFRTYRALCVRDGVKRQKGMKVLVGAWT